MSDFPLKRMVVVLGLTLLIWISAAGCSSTKTASSAQETIVSSSHHPDVHH